MIINSATFHLVNKEPSCEKETNTEENDGEMREDRRVDGGDISGHGTDVGNGHDDDFIFYLKFSVDINNMALNYHTHCIIKHRFIKGIVSNIISHFKSLHSINCCSRTMKASTQKTEPQFVEQIYCRISEIYWSLSCQD